MGKIKNFFQNLYYGFVYGMKGANDEMFRQKHTSNSDGTLILTNASTGSVYKDLLEGRLTQEVKELRYNMYRTYEESRKYRYNGGMRATKMKEEEKKDDGVIDFMQENKMICRSVDEELNRVDSYSEDAFTLDVKYESTPQFRLERFTDRFEVFHDRNSNESFLILYFRSIYVSSDIRYRIFFNFLTGNGLTEDIRNKAGVYGLSEVTFSTRSADGIEDFTKFVLKGCTLSGLIIPDEPSSPYVMLKYKVGDLKYEKLTDKFYDKSAAQKYENKEKKSNDYSDFAKLNSKKHCSECGKEIYPVDAFLSMEAVGMELCPECLEEELTEHR